ncbi:MAG: hypothetical protein AUJ48_02525 [Deltaproteobacteria bacterium CG1_02_45_11]|nr:MAG: hypothetical protein AUJ48_02525 [Deltaproteobacteria bacterium CG1_02_45_11]
MTYPPPPGAEFQYIIKEIPVISIPSAAPALIDVDLSDSPIPLWATDVYLYLVYKGELGSENEAVAVGFKDISEPTPVDYFNVMDKICLNGSLFVSGSSEAITVVDGDENGIADPDEWDVYPHKAENIHIRFSPLDNPQDATDVSSPNNNYEKAILNPGEHFRLIILSDYEFNRSTSVEHTKITTEDQCVSFHGIFPRPAILMTAVQNQVESADPVICGGQDPCYVRYISEFHTTRGVESFFSVIFNNPAYPTFSYCSYAAE